LPSHQVQSGRQRPAAATLVVALLFCGCGGDADGFVREAVSGRVTLDGQPLAGGAIRFIPKGGDQGAASWGRVTDGAYAIAASDGPVAGEYSVAITSEGSTEPIEGPPGEEPKADDRGAEIPEIYNARTTLQATVEPGKANSFDFPLSSKQSPGESRRSRAKR